MILFFSIFAIVLFLPLLIPVMLILRFTGEGEIFFYKTVLGEQIKFLNYINLLLCLKDSPNIGSGTITLKNDPRILPTW